MKLSIIVAAYNIQGYIDKCLDSLHFQEFNDVEFLIIDDGSNDQTAKHIKNFIKEKKDRRFKYYYKENGGLSDTRNFGMMKAIGEYIWFVDGDDFLFYEKNLLDKLMLCVFSNQLDILIFNCMYDEHWSQKYANKICLSLKSDVEVKTGIQMLNRKEFSFSVWHMMYKRKMLLDNQIKFRKNSTAEDLLFTVNCLLKAKRVLYNAEVGYVYVYRENSITKTKNQKYIIRRINDVINASIEIDSKIKNLDDNNLSNLLVPGYIAQALTAFATGYVNIPRLEMENFFKGKKLNKKEKIKKIILLYMPNKIRQILCKKILGM